MLRLTVIIEGQDWHDLELALDEVRRLVGLNFWSGRMSSLERLGGEGSYDYSVLEGNDEKESEGEA